MSALTFDTVALRMLAKRVDELITINRDNLGTGNALVPGDANATALNYSSAVGYIRALHDILGVCEDVEDQLRKL
jgi:hypothetical protein